MYADPKFNAQQMYKIWDGFARFDLSEQQVAVYADPRFSAEQMTEILRGYEAELPDEQIKTFADPDLDVDQMQEMRESLESAAGFAQEEIELQAMLI